MTLARRFALAIVALAAPAFADASAAVAVAAPAVTTLARVPAFHEPAAYPGRFIGPVSPTVAGHHVLWLRDATSAEGATERTAVVAAPLDGGPRRVVYLGGREIALEAGTGGALAATTIDSWGGEDRYTPYEIRGERVNAGPLGGPFPAVGRCIGPVAAEGARVALVSGERCDTIVVIDALTGADVARFPIDAAIPPGAPAPAPTAPSGAARQKPRAGTLSLAGDHVVWTLSDAAPVLAATGDVATGAAAALPLPAAAQALVIAYDGRIAFRHGSGVVLGASDGPRKGVSGLDLGSPMYAQLTFAGDDLVVYRDAGPRGGTAVLAVAPDGTARTLLRAAHAPTIHEPQPDGAIIDGLDAEGDRLAWVARSCDDAVVQTATLAALKAEPQDLRLPQPCPRPRIDRARLTLDRRGRTEVPIRCPRACAGRLVLTARDGVGERLEVAIARFAYARAGRHRVALRAVAAYSDWLAAGGRDGRAIVVSVSATADGRPVFAQRSGRIRRG